MQALIGAALGVVFGCGLALGGMTRPEKVLAFLDFGGAWDPSLALVMAGAIAVYAPLYRWVVRRTKPWYMQEFVVFAGQQLDAPLLLGAAVFGTGWGLIGYCPGPALVAAGTGSSQGLAFALSMLAGMGLFQGFERARAAHGADNGRHAASSNSTTSP